MPALPPKSAGLEPTHDLVEPTGIQFHRRPAADTRQHVTVRLLAQAQLLPGNVQQGLFAFPDQSSSSRHFLPPTRGRNDGHGSPIGLVNLEYESTRVVPVFRQDPMGHKLPAAHFP